MAAPTIELGAKGFTPTSSTIYSIANSLAHVEIDSSALDKLKPSSSSSSLHPSLTPSSDTNPRFLPPVLARAAIAVFLNKLLLSDSSIRRSLPALLQQTLALSSGFEKVDFSSSTSSLHFSSTPSSTAIKSKIYHLASSFLPFHPTTTQNQTHCFSPTLIPSPTTEQDKRLKPN